MFRSILIYSRSKRHLSFFVPVCMRGNISDVVQISATTSIALSIQDHSFTERISQNNHSGNCIFSLLVTDQINNHSLRSNCGKMDTPQDVTAALKCQSCHFSSHSLSRSRSLSLTHSHDKISVFSWNYLSFCLV